MLPSLYQLNITIYNKDKLKIRRTMLAYFFLLDSSYITINNHFIGDIQRKLICITEWFLSKGDTNKYVQQLC